MPPNPCVFALIDQHIGYMECICTPLNAYICPITCLIKTISHGTKVADQPYAYPPPTTGYNAKASGEVLMSHKIRAICPTRAQFIISSLEQPDKLHSLRVQRLLVSPDECYATWWVQVRPSHPGWSGWTRDRSQSDRLIGNHNGCLVVYHKEGSLCQFQAAVYRALTKFWLR